MNKPKREDYATAADFNFWMCAWQHDEIERLLDELKESRRVISVFVAEGSPHLTRIDAALGAADQPTDCPHCGLSIERCNAARLRGAIACCPDCNHRAAAQPTAAADDARDAARYRWLRDHSSGCDLGDAGGKTARVRIGRELFYAQTLDDALDKLRALDNTPDRPLCGYCHGFGTVPHYTYALQLDNGVTPGQTVMRTCPTCKGTGRG